MNESPSPPSRSRPPQRPQSRLLGCMGFMVVGLAVMAGFVVLAFLSQGFLLPVILIVGGAFGVVFFHYIVWGWWLGGIIRDEAEREASQEREACEEE